jgi:hypothetical protein
MKVKSFLLSLVMLTSIAAFSSNATSVDPGNNKVTVKERVANMTKEQKDARIAEMKVRVHEIKAMDRSQLSRSERKAIRQELKDINKEARELGTKDLAVVILGGALFGVLLLFLIA